MQMRSKKFDLWLVLLMALATLAVIVHSWRNPRPVAAQFPPPTVTDRFGLVGITRGYTARLAVFNSASLGGGSCSGEMRFLGSSGQKQFTLNPGGKAALNLNGSGVIPSSSPVGTRFEVGGLVLINQWTGDTNPCVSSFQVYENSTGVTSVYSTPTP
jgi:hypothetical protein